MAGEAVVAAIEEIKVNTNWRRVVMLNVIFYVVIVISIIVTGLLLALLMEVRGTLNSEDDRPADLRASIERHRRILSDWATTHQSQIAELQTKLANRSPSGSTKEQIHVT